MATEESKSFCIYESLDTAMVEEGGNCRARVATFLKPCSKGITSQASVFPTISETVHHNKVLHFKGWKNPQRKWGDWVEAMAGKHASTWNQSGICDALLSSMYEIRCSDQSLILSLVEHWNPETNTFVFPWGEATITLEDVAVLGGFSVLGEPASLPLTAESAAKEAELSNIWREMGGGKSKRDHRAWIKFFMEGEENEERRDLEHVGFLSLWLSRFVFPSLPDSIIGKNVFPIAVHLSHGTRVALAPAVLASLYENLRLLKQQVTSPGCESVAVLGLFQLVQLWAFERFPILGSHPPAELKPGEPRAARWHKSVLNARASVVDLALKSVGNFRWRPYASDLRNWCFVSPYKDNAQLVANVSDSAEELESFGHCLCASELVGLGGCVEKYMPHRVAMQFGIDQHVPGEFAAMDPSYKGNFSFYVPARSYKPCVSLEYLNWWRASKMVQGKEGEMKGMMALKHDQSHFSGLNNEIADCEVLLLSDEEEGGQEHAAGSYYNPLDVEDYPCTNVGTSSRPVDIDKYI